VLVHGADDMHAVTALAREYFADIVAPAKELVLLEGFGHMALLLAPERVHTELLRLVAAAPRSPGGPA